MRTLILCGGKGTRARPHTVEVPKPLMDVAGQPILLHVMGIYASQGFTDFVLAAGYKADMVAELAARLPAHWTVEVRDTGVDADTGTRVARCAPEMGARWFLTYADGLGAVDLHALAAFHARHGGAVTVTTVPLPSPYGTIDIGPDGRVVHFREKPRLPDHWVNAGFFVVDQRASTWFGAEDFERQVLPALGRAGELFAYRHHGFWQSMDTYKDAMELSALAGSGPRPPWSVHAEAGAGGGAEGGGRGGGAEGGGRGGGQQPDPDGIGAISGARS
ncbi:MAG: sugar phosphate nucleotidyltransferase [Actinomycetota bacterium]|jgi:glucose-1-phosphate cytidylyltransferase|nr:sugar phosphate nucleotidyltransferase [Actinomycetota bacterium]